MITGIHYSIVENRFCRESDLPFDGTENGDIILAFDGSKAFGLGGNDWIVHSGHGEAHGGKGRDTLIGWFGDAGLELDGGVGDDWVLTFSGDKTTTIGGLGKDWIWNTSKGGILYGDTITGFDANGNKVNHEDPNNADIFWWWPSTTIMDGSRLDALKFFRPSFSAKSHVFRQSVWLMRRQDSHSTV